MDDLLHNLVSTGTGHNTRHRLNGESDSDASRAQGAAFDLVFQEGAPVSENAATGALTGSGASMPPTPAEPSDDTASVLQAPRRHATGPQVRPAPPELSDDESASVASVPGRGETGPQIRPAPPTSPEESIPLAASEPRRTAIGPQIRPAPPALSGDTPAETAALPRRGENGPQVRPAPSTPLGDGAPVVLPEPSRAETGPQIRPAPPTYSFAGSPFALPLSHGSMTSHWNAMLASRGTVLPAMTLSTAPATAPDTPPPMAQEGGDFAGTRATPTVGGAIPLPADGPLDILALRTAGASHIGQTGPAGASSGFSLQDAAATRRIMGVGAQNTIPGASDQPFVPASNAAAHSPTAGESVGRAGQPMLPPRAETVIQPPAVTTLPAQSGPGAGIGQAAQPGDDSALARDLPPRATLASASANPERTGSWTTPTIGATSSAPSNATFPSFSGVTQAAAPPLAEVLPDALPGFDIGLPTPLAQTSTTAMAPAFAALNHTPPATAQAIAQQIATAMNTSGRESDSPIELTLDPPELGRVRMQVGEVAGIMTLTIHAERPETADLMRRHLELLAQEFAQSGLDAPTVHISQEDAGHNGRDPEERTEARPTPTPELSEPDPLPHPAQRTAPGGLDLRL